MSLPRVTSRTPLAVVPEFAFADSKSPTLSYPPSNSTLLPTSMSHSQLTSHPHIAALIAAFHPRKPKQRTTFAALILLVCLTTYIFIAHSSVSPALALRNARSGDARGTTSEQLALALETIQNARLKEAARLKSLAASSTASSSKSSHAADAQELTMSPSEELAAITFFLASLPQNVIPHTVDPKKPIDPQLVLDFDTRGAKAKEELDALVEDVWSRNPVFLWSKFYSPASRELKSLLASLNLHPSPTIIDVDTREDADVLSPLLTRLLAQTPAAEVPAASSTPSSSTASSGSSSGSSMRLEGLPVLLIGGRPIYGGLERVKELFKTEELHKMVGAAGAVVNGAKKKKHRKH